MKKIALAVILTLTLAGTASAQHRGGAGGYHHGGGGNWVAPLVGGMILGGAIYGLSQPSYAAPYYPAPPQYRTECQMVPVYDRYGYYRGERRECYQVPNY